MDKANGHHEAGLESSGGGGDARPERHHSSSGNGAGGGGGLGLAPVAVRYSRDRKALMVARLQAQKALMAGAKRNRENPFAKSKYATLEAVLETVAEPLTVAGLVLSQWCGPVEAAGPKGDQFFMTVHTSIEHAETSQWMEVSLQIPLAKRDAQGVGSAMTYGRRYTLKALLGIPEVDDDGAAASGQESELRPKRKSAAEAKKDGTTETFNAIRQEIAAASTIEHLRHVGKERAQEVEDMPERWRDLIRAEYEDKLEDLKGRGHA